MKKNKDLQRRKEAAIPRGFASLAPFFIEKARGAEIWDLEGHRYIDFGAGVAVLNTGHCHPLLIEAVKNQLDQFSHTAFQVVPYASYVSLAEKINKCTPGNFAKKTAFFTTGAEAVENAIKIARAYTKRPGIISFSGGFHGRTLLTLSLTGKVDPYKVDFGPFVPSIYQIPTPIELHGKSIEHSLNAIDTLFKSTIAAKEVAAIIFEPIQGEGGFYVMPASFLKKLNEICQSHGILLIADEIQTGFGRTGKLFAMQHYEIVTDLIVMAKGLAGGLPLSAVTGRSEIMDAPVSGGLGGTYAGNPLSIASAHTVLDIIESENLCARANMLGGRLISVLKLAQTYQPRLAEIRGLGSMIAIEFMQAGSSIPDMEFTKHIQNAAFKEGLLLLSCGINNNVIRFLYPLTIDNSTFEEGLAILSRILRD